MIVVHINPVHVFISVHNNRIIIGGCLLLIHNSYSYFCKLSIDLSLFTCVCTYIVRIWMCVREQKNQHNVNNKRHYTRWPVIYRKWKLGWMNDIVIDPSSHPSPHHTPIPPRIWMYVKSISSTNEIKCSNNDTRYVTDLQVDDKTSQLCKHVPLPFHKNPFPALNYLSY